MKNLLQKIQSQLADLHGFNGMGLHSDSLIILSRMVETVSELYAADAPGYISVELDIFVTASQQRPTAISQTEIEKLQQFIAAEIMVS